jgi:galactonate dehydratase
MKITAVRTFAIEPRWLFVKIETDEGLTGWGECQGDKAHVTAQAVHSYDDYLVGQDPRRVVHHWQSLYRGPFWRAGTFVTAAISGLEIAMWDILGKSLGAPVWHLLGGAVRDRIRVYARPDGDTPDELAAGAKAVVAGGYTAMKFCPLGKVHLLDHYRVVEEATAKVQAAREAIGTTIDLLLDFHGLVGPAMAVQLEEAMRPYHPFFIEEPVLPENVDAMARLAPQFKTPIATGERLVTKWGFREVLERGAATVLQPDPCVCGGIFETRQIGTMAEVHYAALAPHNASGPINLAAALHVDACTPNFLIQEFIGDRARGEGGYLVEPFVVTDGFIELPTKPGLGIEVDEERLAAIPLGPLSDVGRWFHDDDGSVADW